MQLRADPAGLARERGFRGRRPSGSDALALARQFKPDAITLDIELPDIDGWGCSTCSSTIPRRGRSRST